MQHFAEKASASLQSKDKKYSMNKRRLDDFRTYDPRTKLHILLAYFIMTLANWKLIPVLICVLAGALIMVTTRPNYRVMLTSLAWTVIIELIIGVLCIIFLPTLIGVYIMLKLITFSIVYFNVIRSIKQGELLDGLAYGFGLRTKTARRIMRLLDFQVRYEKENRRVRKAQRARGVDPYGGSILQRFRKKVLLTVPNVQNTIVKQRRQRDAIEMKLYTSLKKRSPVNELKITWIDKTAMIFMIIILLVSIELMLFF